MMNMKLGKKSGSSLLLVLMAFTVLITFGMAVLSLTLSSYRKRIVEGKVQNNFYLSEAGLDIAYGKIGKVVDEAIQAGDDGVTVLMEGIDQAPNYTTESSITISRLDLNHERDVVLNGGHSDYINDDGSLNQSNINKKQNEVFQEVYKDYVQRNIGDRVEGNYNLEDSSGVNPSIQILNDSNNPLQFNSQDNTESMSVNLISTYNKNNITKKVSACYDILVPDYKDTYYVKTTVINLPKNPIWRKALSVGGDMDISNGAVNINGDIFVQGTGTRNSGIDINGSGANITVAGRMLTNGNLQASASNTLVDVKGNLYAKNVIIKEGADDSTIKTEPGADITSPSKTYDGSVFTYSTMSLNAQRCHINILGGFYGINDNYYYNSEDPNQNNSSYIFINSTDLGSTDSSGNLIGSSLSIGKEAYITGTSYILRDNSPIYQTGESVAIKGNYTAYSFPLSSDEAGRVSSDPNKTQQSLKENNVVFEYFDPLQLVSKFANGNSLLVHDKSDYFKFFLDEYIKDKQNNYEFNYGKGISIPDGKIHASGAVVANNSSYSDTLLIDDFNEIKSKKLEYEKAIYELGDDTSNPPPDLNVPEKNTTTQIDFSKINTHVPSSQDINNQFILLDGTAQNYAIVAPGGDVSNVPEDTVSIPLADSTKGIIIINGDLYMCGPINFKGTIIVNGNVQVDDSSNKTITYDESYVSKLIVYNYYLFKDVFQNGSADQPFSIQTDAQIGNGTEGINIIKDKLIKRKNWSIIK